MAELVADAVGEALPDHDDDAVPVLPVGAEIAPGYEVVEHLRRGDALDVYAVFSTERLCSCVAKTIRPDRARVERVRRRLAQEGYLLQTLVHPLLVRGLETVTEPELVVIVETIPGPSLEEVIEERARRLPITDLCHLGSQITAATHYLHRSGYLHLDIRPSNIVGHGGVAKLIDLVSRALRVRCRGGSGATSTCHRSRPRAAWSPRPPTSGASAPPSTRRPRA